MNKQTAENALALISEAPLVGKQSPACTEVQQALGLLMQGVNCVVPAADVQELKVFRAEKAKQEAKDKAPKEKQAI